MTHCSKTGLKDRFYEKHQFEIELYVIDTWIFYYSAGFLDILAKIRVEQKLCKLQVKSGVVGL